MDQILLKKQLIDEGFCILPSLLSPDELTSARDALDKGVDMMRRSGVGTHTASIDPNEANVRVYNLPAVSPVFVDLLRHAVAIDLVKTLLGPDFLVSNFTANIALPGSGSMKIHSDQALVIPPPWDQPWAANVIWCLNDVHECNGATRYVPRSHLYRTFADVPPDVASYTKPFEAPAGSAIIMEGRLWHTSGANVTQDERRAMLFAYYSSDFIRQQMNWEATLPPATKAGFDAETRKFFGLGPAGNTRMGGDLTRLRPN